MFYNSQDYPRRERHLHRIYVCIVLQQSDLTNDPLSRHRHGRDAARNFGRKRPRTTAPTGLASAASNVSDALESNDLEEPQSVALLAAPGQERKIRDIDQEMVDDGGTDDSNDENYGYMNDSAAPEIQGRSRSWKRVRRTKDTEHNDVETPSTYSLNVSYQAIAATSSGSMQESEAIPIHGYLTLKTIESKVVYCLTFSQELLPRPQDRGQKQNCTTDLEGPRSAAPREAPAKSSIPHDVAPYSGIRQAPLRRQTTRSPWTPEEDATVLKMKKDGYSWEEIHAALPHRTKATIQVRYSTKLKT